MTTQAPPAIAAIETDETMISFRMIQILSEHHKSSTFRSRAAGKVILPRARVEFFNLLNLLGHRAAQRPFCRFSHLSGGLQFDQSFVDGAQRDSHHTPDIADGD